MATLIAAIASGLTAIVLISISACGGGTRLWIVFVGVISAFVAVYSVTLYLLNRFIFEKINPIYKTIHSLNLKPVSYTHLRAHETVLDLVCRLLLEKKK